MGLKADDMAGAERQRSRRWVSVIAVLVPIVGLAGAATWFIRTYVMPPMIAIAEPQAVASADPTSTKPAPSVAAPVSETIGGSTPPAGPNGPVEPVVRYSTNSAEVWASVPLPGPPRPPREMQSVAAAPAVTASEPVIAAVPLPPRRPRINTAEFDLPAVPLPRPRPLASN
jgi:hypothetical protein